MVVEGFGADKKIKQGWGWEKLGPPTIDIENKGELNRERKKTVLGSREGGERACVTHIL